MLSRQPISWPQLMHAEPGETSERRSGTRAATTFMKLPSARPGAKRESSEREAHQSTTRNAGGRRSSSVRRVVLRLPRLRLRRGCRSVVACLLLGPLEHDEEVVPVARRVRGGLALDDAGEDEADQRLRERLHVEELALGDRFGDLVGTPVANEVGDPRVHDHHLDGRDAPAVRAGQQPLADDAAQHAGEDRADDLLLLGREELDDAPARLGRVDGVERREDEVARLGGLQGDLGRLGVAELADEDDVRVLAQRAPQPLAERAGVEPDLALADDAALLLVDDLDRILDRQDVVASRAVDVVDHRRERRRLARAGRARDEDETARLVREALDSGRQAELLERRDEASR